VKGAIGIPVKISIVYHAKARGRVYCRANLPQSIPTVPGLYYVSFQTLHNLIYLFILHTAC
jgi:hypothetical protein